MPISGCVYLIYPKVVDKHLKMYVGSTTEFLVRCVKHKNNCDDERTKDYKVYKHIRENGGWDAFNMSVIEEREDFEDEIELRKREQFHLDRVPNEMRLNSRNAYLGEEEIKTYKLRQREINKDYFHNYQVEYNKNNREKLNMKLRKWRAENPELSLKQKREWVEKNREKVNKQAREWAAKNRDAMNKRRRELRAKKQEEQQ
jgi:hypothetical protein